MPVFTDTFNSFHLRNKLSANQFLRNFFIRVVTTDVIANLKILHVNMHVITMKYLEIGNSGINLWKIYLNYNGTLSIQTHY